MKKLNVNQMETVNGGKLCQTAGYAAAGAVGGAFGGPVLGAVMYLGAWIGCSID